MELTGYARVGQLLIERAAHSATLGTAVTTLAGTAVSTFGKRQRIVIAPPSGYGLVAAELIAPRPRLTSRDYGLAA
jgi:hypothetical protein